MSQIMNILYQLQPSHRQRGLACLLLLWSLCPGNDVPESLIRSIHSIVARAEDGTFGHMFSHFDDLTDTVVQLSNIGLLFVTSEDQEKSDVKKVVMGKEAHDAVTALFTVRSDSLYQDGDWIPNFGSRCDRKFG